LKSIRRYLVIILLSAITLINFLSAVQGYRGGMSQAEQTFDQQMINVAQIIADIDSFEDHELPEMVADTLVYQIWTVNGVLLERTRNAPFELITQLESGFNFANFANYRWRTYAMFDEHHHHWVLLAQRMDIRYEMADRIIVESILPVVIGIPVAGLIIWFFVGSGLSPLYKLASQLHKKHVEDLTPLKLDNPPQELAQVLHSVNQLMQRLSDSVTREKRFASDAAHELRTPISVLKIHLHNLLHDHPELKSQTAEFQSSLDRLEHLVDQMLALYRCAPDQYIAKFETVDLYKLAQDVIAQQYQSIEQRQQTIELLGNSVEISANSFAIETLIQNLLSNAVKYSPEGSELRIETGMLNGQAYIRVEDSGPGIKQENRAQVFERFYRVVEDTDTLSNSPVTGCGLGLAIVQNIAHQHHARIELSDSSYVSGLAVTVIFPGVDSK
jgi:two-component system sensor histidine kinase QseC